MHIDCQHIRLLSPKLAHRRKDAMRGPNKGQQAANIHQARRAPRKIVAGMSTFSCQGSRTGLKWPKWV